MFAISANLKRIDTTDFRNINHFLICNIILQKYYFGITERESDMASTKAFLDFVLEQISDLKEISYRPMMGEYVIYFRGKVVGGVYDDQFLLKPTRSALRLIKDSGNEPQTDIPYEGAKEMLVADIDDREMICRLIEAIESDLPEAKGKKRN